MKLAFDSRPEARAGEILVRFFAKTPHDKIPARVSDAEFSADANKLLLLHHENLLCIGLGEPSKIDADTLRTTTAVAISFLKKCGRVRVAIDAREWPEFAGAIVTGAVLADYRFEKFRTKRMAAIETLRCIVDARSLPQAKQAGHRAQIIAGATNFARELGNLPGNVIVPETLAAEARRMAKTRGLRITVLDEKALRAKKFGGLLAVGAGSVHPPRLIVLEHNGGPRSQAPIALVGKAITFDSGGISIKPTSGMEEMIFDKCGGCAVLGAMAGIAELGLKRNVVGIIASAENLPSASAYRPGDIVTTYDGQHVEVITTDAEGRIVLADALAYARKDKRASAMIDLATLTGACGVALGEHTAGLWSTSDDLKNKLLAAASKTGERVWPMPLFDDFTEQIKSEVAAWKNSGGRLGGACTAAAFLKAFAGNTPWAHLDIAYTAELKKERGGLPRGATGFGVRMLVELVEGWR